MDGLYNNDYSAFKDYELSTSSLGLQNQDHQAVYMNPEQTFHTPSFGDEEFDIPQLSLHPSMAQDANVANMAYHHHHHHHQQQQQVAAQSLHSHAMAEMSMAPDPASFVTAGNHQMMGGGPYQQEPMYMVPMKPQDGPIRHEGYGLAPSQPTYTVTMNPQHNLVIRAQHPQQQHHHHQQQQPPPPPQHALGGHIVASSSSPTSGQQGGLLTTISQSQLSSQLGVHFNMGQPPSNGSPRSNQTSPGQETSEDSDDNVHHLGHMMRGLGGKRPSPEPAGNGKTGGSVKKAKVPKKKKKRDPNEPQKPVSAYALFFRDTQAAIKGQNPNASFGEVSKIVASMWDSLDEDHKNVYKKRTEAAKKEYLKALAAYRASLVSKSASEHADSMYGTSSFGATPTSSTSPPSSSPSTVVTSSYAITSQYGSSPTVSSSTGILCSTGPMCGPGGPGNSPPQELSPLQKKSPLLTSLMEGGSPQGQPVSPPHAGATQQVMGSPPNVLHSNQMQPGQPPSVGMMQPLSHSMAPQQQHQQQQQQHQQQQQQQQSQAPPASPLQPASYQAIGMIPNPQASPNQGQGVVGGQPPSQMVNYDRPPTCLRNGCPNPAMESPEWDNEYCSNDCVVSHCRDVFTAWVASRQTSNSFASVK